MPAGTPDFCSSTRTAKMIPAQRIVAAQLKRDKIGFPRAFPAYSKNRACNASTNCNVPPDLRLVPSRSNYLVTPPAASLPTSLLSGRGFPRERNAGAVACHLPAFRRLTSGVESARHLNCRRDILSLLWSLRIVGAAFTSHRRLAM